MIFAVGIAIVIGGFALIYWQVASARKNNRPLTEHPPRPLISRRQYKLRIVVGFLVILLGAAVIPLEWMENAVFSAWSLVIALSLVLVIVVLVVIDMAWSLKHIGKEFRSVKAAEKKLQQAYMDAKRREKSKQGNGKL